MFSFKVGLPTKLVDLFELPHRAILILLPHFLRTSILGGVRLVRCLLSWEISESSGFCNFSSKGTVITIFHKIISLKNFLSLLKSLFRKRLAFLTLLWCHWCSQVYISVLNKWRSGQTRVCIERVDKNWYPQKLSVWSILLVYLHLLYSGISIFDKLWLAAISRGTARH